MLSTDLTAEDRSSPKQAEGRSAAEWVTFVVSLIVVGGIASVAVYAHFSQPEATGPRLRIDVRVNQFEARGDQYYIPYQMANDGAAPAHDVEFTAEIARNGTVVEESTTSIAFLPVGGTVDGEIVTGLDPAHHVITARVGILQSP